MWFSVAQLVEYLPDVQKALGSNPQHSIRLSLLERTRVPCTQELEARGPEVQVYYCIYKNLSRPVMYENILKSVENLTLKTFQ